MELEGDLDPVQVRLVGSLKRFQVFQRVSGFSKKIMIFQKYLEVDHMSLCLGSADVDVKCVYLKNKCHQKLTLKLCDF